MGGAFPAAVAGNEIVNVRRGHHQGDPSELTINCPDKVGLGCDFARIVFEFGLSVVKGGKQAEPSQVFSFLKQKTKKVHRKFYHNRKNIFFFYIYRWEEEEARTTIGKI
jgi:hypothetical protein